MSEVVNLEIEGLSSLQLLELKSALSEFGEDCITEKEKPSLKAESLGEPSLIEVLIQMKNVYPGPIYFFNCS